jgi:diaminopropionate ammonia-lyase
MSRVIWSEGWDRGEAPSTSWLDVAATAAARRFHAELPGYRATPLHDLPGLAAGLGVGSVRLKDESQRFGLGAFKGLGASYAVHQLALEQPGRLTFITATDGNHGRAVAWAASRLGHHAVVFVPAAASAGRQRAIAERGATVVRVEGTYDDAVRQAARKAELTDAVLLQDSAWEGYDRVPRWIMQGYVTMLDEALEQLGGVTPSHVLLQCGVGSFAAAMAGALRERFGDRRPRVIAVEPTGAACATAAIETGRTAPPEIEGDLHTFMACLSCGRLSTIAWPILRSFADAVAACDDEFAVGGMLRLARPTGSDPRVESGESGAVTTGLLCEAGADTGLRARLALGPESRVLLFSTEGATDPDIYERVMNDGCEALDE